MKNKGFTLVELLAVIAILAILVIIALPNVLSMFNQAKKDTFLTEVKTVYKEISKKYITESMRGNKLKIINNDTNKLSLESNDLKYNVKLDDFGNIKSFQVSNGTYCISGKFNNLGELTTDKIIEGECKTTTKSFSTDTWEDIIDNVRANDIADYKIGDTKEIELDGYGKHTLRIANKSTPNECKNSNYSMSACGFVLEFADIITTHGMNDSDTNIKGFPASNMYTFLNNDIYNSLPSDLKNIIIDTKIISSHGSNDTANFTSTAKLYLLSTAEVWAQGSSNAINNDTSRELTRQLEYYKEKETTTSNFDASVKYNGDTELTWWLRSSDSSNYYSFYSVDSSGDWSSPGAHIVYGVSPAFRIG